MKSQLKKRVIPACVFNMAGACFIVLLFSCVQFGASVYAYADSRLSIADNIKKLTLVQRAMDDPESIRKWDVADLQILLNQPSLKRSEKIVTAWTYHGDSCALDIYFDAKKSVPDYVEFRPLSMNETIQMQYESTDTATQNLYCLKDVLEAQGVSTPSSYARRPLPSWESPYQINKPA